MGNRAEPAPHRPPTGAGLPCASCGRTIDPALPCPHCGAPANVLVAELANVERAIAEMAEQDVRLEQERKSLSGSLKAAMHQRAILAHEIAQRQAQGRGRRSGWWTSHHSGPPPVAGTPTHAPPRQSPPPPQPPDGAEARAGGTAGTGPMAGGEQRAGRGTGVGPPELPAGAVQDTPPGPDRAVPDRPRVRMAPPPREASSREASSRSSQTVMLGMGALLLGIAAVVFVGVAITELDPWAQLGILVTAILVALAGPPALAGRGLLATAGTIAVVGVALVGVAGYALWATGAVGGVPGPVFAGLVAGVIAGAGYGYHLLTGLSVPRHAAVVALQPVLPLLAYEVVTGPAGWALVYSLVAAQNAVVGTLDGHVPARRAWLHYLTWALHAVALAAAASFAVAALALAGTVDTALRAAFTLLLAAAVGLVGAWRLRRDPLPDVAAGLATLAVAGAVGRVAVVALPGRALLPVAAVVAGAGLAVRLLPATARRGPQSASAMALAVVGVFVAGLGLRAGVAAVTAVLPPWRADPAEHPALLAEAVGPAGWQLAAAAALLTAAAVAALPPQVRRESVVTGTAVTALATPAALGLGPSVTPWLLVLAAAALGATGLATPTRRGATVHVVAAGVLGVAAAGASLARPGLTATVLAAVTLTGIVVAGVRPRTPSAVLVTEWAAGAAALALPGAAATAAATAGADPSDVLVTAFVAVCAALGYAAMTLVAHRTTPKPVALGAGLGALAVTIAAFTADGTSATDRAVAALLLAGALLIFSAPRIDASRRPDRLLDGADVAAAGVTAGVVATLARLAATLLPTSGSDATLATGAVLVLAVSLGVRAMPASWRRGPVLGLSVFAGLVALVAGYAGVAGGLRALAAPGGLWTADLSRWPPGPALAGVTWSAPFALALLAVAAAVVLPGPVRYDAAAALGALAALAVPVGLGLDWWTPVAVSCVATGAYAVAAGLSTDARAGLARAVAAGVLALHAVSASVVRPWTTVATLGLVAVIGAVTAALSAAMRALRGPGRTGGPGGTARDEAARITVGGTALACSLLAGPGALAALAAQAHRTTDIVLTTALGGSSLGLGLLATMRRRAPEYLPYGTVGIAGGATATALLSLPTPNPTGVYAAAAALLAVLAELLRASAGHRGPRGRWSVSPPLGALAAAVVPALLAVAAVAPALGAALIDPYQVLAAPWDGPPTVLTDPSASPAVRASSVLAALLLTLAAALAAVGFGGAVTRQAVPVVVPGLAVTLLITPPALGAAWPAGTLSALAVFTIAVLGVALTPPPPPDHRTRPLRLARLLVLAIGLVAGGAGLAGSLADIELSWFTFGGAVAVGTTAALGGRTRNARLLGWLGAAAAAQLFALTTAVLLGGSRPQASFGVLAVGAAAALLAARLPQLRARHATRELAIVEWTGYGSLLLTLALAFDSPTHLAALLVGWGAVLGVSALRPGRTDRGRRALLWSAAASEVGAWWIIMRLSAVTVLEAYALPFAGLALLIGILEVRRRPELGSWTAYGPALVAAFAPSLALLLVSEPEPARHAWVLLGGVGTLILGSTRGQRAPVIVGSVVTTLAALRLLSLAGPWLILIPIGLILLFLGANSERRQRDLERIRGALDRMR